jgi:DUF2075 family protein
MDLNATTFGEIGLLTADEYLGQSLLAMKARFSKFVVTTEQEAAWRVGFRWMHDIGRLLPQKAKDWMLFPEFVAPLISGRPDFVIVTATHILVVEMKTGELLRREGDKKQALGYAVDIWGKLKGAREKSVIPVLLSRRGKNKHLGVIRGVRQEVPPVEVLDLDPNGLLEVLLEVNAAEVHTHFARQTFLDNMIYSPRPSVIEAATSLVARLEDRNVITGLSESREIDRLIETLLSLAQNAQENSSKVVAIVSGAPGAGKTLVGLRLAHDANLQSRIEARFGTPLYLTGNATLVEVLVESLARDESRRTGKGLAETRKSANSKVKLVHGVVGSEIGIESNVVVFDEGQRIWTAERMQSKKGDAGLKSEAAEILSSMNGYSWALLVVLIGEGQEINTGEEGVKTWINALSEINASGLEAWRLFAPPLALEGAKESWVQTSDTLLLQSSVRTDNSANVSEWVRHLLDNETEKAREIRSGMCEFPIYVTRDLEVAKSWVEQRRHESGGTSGILASSKSKRLFNYGIDVAADAGRSINWGAWYLDSLPNLNSSEALEIAATEFKCQGLELDWALVCWSWDLAMRDNEWRPQTLDAGRGRWNQTRNELKANFQFNAYRVLLTRSRKGMIIWVPPGRKSNAMPEIDMNQAASFLVECGAVPLA